MSQPCMRMVAPRPPPMIAIRAVNVILIWRRRSAVRRVENEGLAYSAGRSDYFLSYARLGKLKGHSNPGKRPIELYYPHYCTLLLPH